MLSFTKNQENANEATTMCLRHQTGKEKTAVNRVYDWHWEQLMFTNFKSVKLKHV